MSDLISRQAAIDEIKAVYEWHDVVTEDRMIQHFKVLPSAQPEITKRTAETEHFVPNSDLISRKAAIDAIRELESSEDFSFNNGLICAMNNVAELPSVQEQRWIPVTERLPNGQEEVIVSCHDTSGDGSFDYTSSGWTTTDGEYWIVDNEINHFVVAWCPLPEPYKGEK